MNTITKNLSPIVLCTFLLASHSYSAFDDEASLALRTAIIQNDVAGVRNALSQHADPNYTPTPRSLTIAERLLQKCWYHDKIDFAKALWLTEASCVSAELLRRAIDVPSTYIFYGPVLSYMGYCMLATFLTEKIQCPRASDDTKSPLVLASCQSNTPAQLSIMTALLQAKADVDSADGNGNTALHYIQMYPAGKQLLMRAGAKFNIRNKQAIRVNSSQPDLLQIGSQTLPLPALHYIYTDNSFAHKTQEQIQQTIRNLATVLTDSENKLGGDKNIARIIATYCLFSDDSTPYAFVEAEDDGDTKHILQHRIETHPAFN